MDNYPPGTWAGDPTAPWNQTAPEVVCGACDHITDEQEEGETCDECEAGVMSEYLNEPDWDSMPGGADWDD